MEETKEDLNKWRGIPHSRIGRLNIAKDAVLPKLTVRFNAIPIKISAGFLVAGQADPKIYMGTYTVFTETQNSQNNLEKDEQSWRTYTS